jgi:hypothetical protein
MRKIYPDVVTAIGNVEGFPGIEDVRGLEINKSSF